MARCSFTTKYWNDETDEEVEWPCDSEDEDILNSGKCIFHDEDYLQLGSGSALEEKKSNVMNKVMDKVKKSIADGEALFCIGYNLPDVIIRGNFTKPAYFNQCRFLGLADFSSAKFSGEADFSSAEFIDISS